MISSGARYVAELEPVSTAHSSTRVSPVYWRFVTLTFSKQTIFALGGKFMFSRCLMFTDLYRRFYKLKYALLMSVRYWKMSLLKLSLQIHPI